MQRGGMNVMDVAARRLRLGLQIFSERDGLTRQDQHIHDSRLESGGSKLDAMGAGTELNARW